jgi:hypothetical protein
MLTNTKSFERLKIEQQRILDFTVLICHSVPNLKKTIKGVENDIPHFSIPQPDFFGKEQDVKIKELAKDYKENLSKYLIISSYSFFESYFKSVLEELVTFHGGKDAFIDNIRKKYSNLLNNKAEIIKENTKKIKEPYKKKNYLQYNKSIKSLEDNSNYRNPSELFAVIGIKHIIEVIMLDKFRSVMIPDLLEFGFLLELTDKINKNKNLKDKTIKETFEAMRTLRNKISHGDNPNIDFAKSMEYIKFLRLFAIKIDKHLIDNFFILERYT